MPILSIFKPRPLKLATPATAAFVNVPLNVPGAPGFKGVPGGMATVTVDVSVVTVLPTGILHRHHRLRPVQAVPPVPPPGCVVNASFAAPPTVIFNVALVAPV